MHTPGPRSPSRTPGGALSLAKKQGREEGLTEGLRRNVEDLCEVFDIEITAPRREALARAGVAELEALLERVKTAREWRLG